MFYISIVYFLKELNKNLSWVFCGEERDLDGESEAKATWLIQSIYLYNFCNFIWDLLWKNRIFYS